MSQVQKVRCCIVGGGPAGMMLGALLARSGIQTLVLEKHGDFLRDFRGDTVHPSTLDVIAKLGWLEDFFKRPHQRVTQLKANIEGKEIILANFKHLPSPCKFIVFMPQWDFLNFIEEKARAYPDFRLSMNTEATELIEDQGQIVGVRATTPTGELRIEAELVVACDGRNSILRERAGLKVQDLGAPMDVLWMKIPRLEKDPNETMGWLKQGRMLIFIYRGDYWQMGLVIRKGGFEELKKEGIESFRKNLVTTAPFLETRVNDLSFNDLRLLVVKVDRLEDWRRPGLLCIGDSAHAMSPIGGVGINLAIQDAVAAARLLSPSLINGSPTFEDLKRVQRRREWPTRVTQKIQVLIQNHVIDRVLSKEQPLEPGLLLRLINESTFLQSIPAFLIGLGIRPEQIGPCKLSS